MYKITSTFIDKILVKLLFKLICQTFTEHPNGVAHHYTQDTQSFAKKVIQFAVKLDLIHMKNLF